MNCPHCASMATKEQTKKTSLGYRMFRCESRASEPLTGVQEPRSMFWNSPPTSSCLSCCGDCGTSRSG
jgi:hypothetical protein